MLQKVTSNFEKEKRSLDLNPLIKQEGDPKLSPISGTRHSEHYHPSPPSQSNKLWWNHQHQRPYPPLSSSSMITFTSIIILLVTWKTDFTPAPEPEKEVTISSMADRKRGTTRTGRSILQPTPWIVSIFNIGPFCVQTFTNRPSRINENKMETLGNTISYFRSL